MTQQQTLQLLEERKARTVWDDEQEKWCFPVVDVVAVLTDGDYHTARKYWKVPKGRIAREGNELVTSRYQSTDGKCYKSDIADTERFLCFVQSSDGRLASPRGTKQSRNEHD